MYSIDMREFRRANKMTQQELADYFGVVQGFISNMENGREKVPDKYISKILGDPNVDSSMVKAVAPENEVKMPREVFDKFSLLGTIADQQKVNAEQGRLIADMYQKIDRLTSLGSRTARTEDDAGCAAAK